MRRGSEICASSSIPTITCRKSIPYVVASNEIERVFGGANLVVIGVESVRGDIFQPDILSKLARITDSILSIPGVVRSNVIGLAARKAKEIAGTDEGMVVHPLMETVPHTTEDIGRLKRAVYAESNSVIPLSPSAATWQSSYFSYEFWTGTARVSSHQGTRRVHCRGQGVQSGISINLAWLEIYSERMAYLFFGALAVIMAVLYLSFRSLQGMLVPILTALMSVIWGLGVMGLLSIPMDTFNATTPILIMAVAAGHSVQILKRYYEEYGRLHDSKQAVIESFTKIGPVMLTAGGIAVTSFLALTAFPTLTIRVFGIFTAIGIFSPCCWR